MKLLLFLISTVFVSGQAVAQENCCDTNYFSKQGLFSFLQGDSLVHYGYYPNSAICYIRYTPKNGMPGYYVKFYPSGKVALEIKNLHRHSNTFIDNVQMLIAEGDYQTWYPNGNLRSVYSVDSLAKLKGPYVRYDSDGKQRHKNFYKNLFKNGELYQGNYVYDTSDSTAIVWRYKKGVIYETYYVNPKTKMVDSAFSMEEDLMVPKKLKNKASEYAKLVRLSIGYYR